jgi:chromosome segregation ATPase
MRIQKSAIFLLAVVAASSLFAQNPPAAQPGAAAAGQQAGKFYEELIKAPLVPHRSEQEIGDDRKRAEQDAAQADKAVAGAEARVKETDTWLKMHAGEIEKLKKEVGVAKKEKRDSDKLLLEAQVKQLELVKDYLEQMREVRRQEVEVARGRKDVASSTRKVYDAEQDLVSKAEQWKRTPAADPNFVKGALAAADASAKTLEQMREVASQNANVANRAQVLAEKRAELGRARNKLLSEDRIRKFRDSQEKAAAAK